MEHAIEVNSPIVVRENELVVEVLSEDYQRWAVALTLLSTRLCSSLTFRCKGSDSLSFFLTTEPDATKAKVSRSGDRRYRVDLSVDSLEYLQYTLLRAVRDGAAEANHVHLEGEYLGKSFDITMMFETFAPPMPGEEARRMILGS